MPNQQNNQEARDALKVMESLEKGNEGLFLWFHDHGTEQTPPGYDDYPDSFNGTPEELNTAVRRGLYLKIHQPDAFKFYNEGFVNGCGYGIERFLDILIYGQSIVETSEKGGS